MIETSEKTDLLSVALHKAQGGIKTVTTDSNNPHFGSRYASLAAVVQAAHRPLQDAGLSVLQAAGSTDGALIHVTTRLTHTSGQWIQSTLALRSASPDPQKIVALVTYGRRCSLMAMIGLAPDDDDGNEASAGHTQPPQQPAAPKAAPRSAQQPPRSALGEQAVARAANAGGTYRFGKLKGHALLGSDYADLEWYAEAIQAGIDDPARAKWRDSAIAHHREILAAIAATPNTVGDVLDDTDEMPY